MVKFRNVALTAGAAIALSAAPAIADTETSCEPTGGQTEGSYGNGKYFVADSFSFGVEREMKEAGEKGGTESVRLTFKQGFEGREDLERFHRTGKPIRTLTLTTEGRSADGSVCYLKYKLDRCFVKSWSTSGDADDRPTEEVAFYYNKIAFSYAQTKDGVSVNRVDSSTQLKTD